VNLPPLTALRAFEAAARTGSFVLAGAEIGVSAAAISQHIRKLEAVLGKQLFVRLNNRIVLTDAGQLIFEGAHAGLTLIAEAIEPRPARMRRARVVVSCIESVAEKWLVPALAGFTAAQGDVRFEIRVEPDPVDLDARGVDLRLGYDPAHYPQAERRVLGHDVVLPLCSPDYLARRDGARAGGIAAVPPEDLIDIDWGPSFGSRPGWAAWCAAAGVAPIDVAGASRVASSALAIDLARAGLGVVLGQRMVAAADLAAGRLVALSDCVLPLRHAYCLVLARPAAQRPAAAALADWLAARWGEQAVSA